MGKIYLKRFDVRRKRTEGSTLVGPKQNEFGNYIKKYGSCLTRLFPPANDQYKILAAAPGGLIAGVACNSSRVFFLPFLTNNFSSNELVDVAASVSEAVITHRSNKAETVPEWLAEIKFQAEVEILKKLDALQISVDALKSDLSKVESAKMILISSGESLVLRLHQILEDYFGLQIQRIEKYEEDFIILNQDKAGCIVEIKGIKNHIAREHLTKTEAHRDMNGLDATIPALLIINDNTAVSGFEDRKKVNVPGDLVKYATVLNVKILRSIDLLQFMIATEKQTKEERCALLKPIIFSEGGGHLVLKNESLFLKQTK